MEADDHLVLAERHIKEAESRIAKQRIAIQELASQGHATMEGERVLSVMEDTLAAMKEHHQLMVLKSENKM